MKILNKRLVFIFCSIVTLLLIPLIAMQFTTEVNWEPNDFVIAGTLLFGTATMVELILRKTISKRLKLVLIIITIALLALIWMELAVGIVGTPFAGS